MYSVSAPTLHHYPHSLTGNYGLPQGLQRPSPATLASMYGGAGLGYSPSDWGLAGHNSMSGGGNLSRDHPYPHREYLSCAAAAAAASVSNSTPLSLTHHSSHQAGSSYSTSACYPGVGPSVHYGGTYEKLSLPSSLPTCASPLKENGSNNGADKSPGKLAIYLNITMLFSI